MNATPRSGLDDFLAAGSFLVAIGLVEKPLQETRRELWTVRGCEVSIDEWPGLPPFVEIEAASDWRRVERSTAARVERV